MHRVEVADEELNQLRRLIAGDPNLIKPESLVETFSTLFEKNRDERIFLEAAQLLANYYRKSSTYIRCKINCCLAKANPIGRVYFCNQFFSMTDVHVPRSLILSHVQMEKFLAVSNESAVFPSQVYAFGTNRTLNLGVISDGRPVIEPKTVNIETVVKISMSNSHTLFLTVSGQVYGCGNTADSRLGGGENREKGFVMTPLKIDLPAAANEIVLDIWAGDTYSMILTKGLLHLFGKCERLDACGSKISTNYSVYKYFDGFNAITRSEDGTVSFRNVRGDLDYEIDRSKRFFESPMRAPPIWKIIKTTISIDDQPLEITLSLVHGVLKWRYGSIGDNVVLNVTGHFLQKSHIIDYNVDSKGIIWILLDKMGLYRGRLRAFEKLNEGFYMKTLKSNRRNQRIAEHAVFALLEEIPGTWGVDCFGLSPDGCNCIFQIGSLGRKEMSKIEWDKESFAATDSYDSVLGEIEQRTNRSVRPSRVLLSIQINGTRDRLAEIHSKFSSNQLQMTEDHTVIAFDLRNRVAFLFWLLDLENGSEPARLVENISPPETNFEEFIDARIRKLEKKFMQLYPDYNLRYYYRRASMSSLVSHIKANSAISKCGVGFEDAFPEGNIGRLIMLPVLYIPPPRIIPDTPNETGVCLSFLEACIRVANNFFLFCADSEPQRLYDLFFDKIRYYFEMLNSILDDLENDIEGYHLKVGARFEKIDKNIKPVVLRTGFRLANIEKIWKERVEEGRFTAAEFPLDCEIFCNLTDRDIMRIFTSSKILKLSFPEVDSFMENGKLDLSTLSKSEDAEFRGLIAALVYNFLVHRHQKFFKLLRKRGLDGGSVKANSPSLYKYASYDEIEMFFRKFGLRLVAVQYKDLEIGYCLMYDREETLFVSPSDGPSEVWNLISSDGVKIPCSKYLLMLHSASLIAKVNFDQMTKEVQFGGGSEEEVFIDVDQPEEVVKNALTGLVAPTSLRKLTSEQLVNVIIFYDFHLMLEAKDDAIDTIFETATIHWLMKSYDVLQNLMSMDEDFGSRFEKHPHLAIYLRDSHELPFQWIKRATTAVYTEKETHVLDFSRTIANWRIYKGDGLMQLLFDGKTKPEIDPTVFLDFLEDYGHELKISEKFSQKPETSPPPSTSGTSRIRTTSEASHSLPSTKREREKTVSESVARTNEDHQEKILENTVSTLELSSPKKELKREASSPVDMVSPRLASSPSLDDFPVASTSSPSSSTLKNKKFYLKGAKFFRANQMLQPASPKNAWSVENSPAGSSKSNPTIDSNAPVAKSPTISFKEIIDEQTRKQKNRNVRKAVPLEDIEKETMAKDEILETYKQGFNREAAVSVDVVERKDDDQEDEEPEWVDAPASFRK
ncbi:unnamed protein product [Caenorhabditis auriculariae]|uniref:Uncharacterized protein n=1 Tax=Caenorhabditis auriculariae TaxID=2777116 RepID=A0A8S1GQ94_9PELO|nr:unnamed protein product [Caenorhabditis auriculariae]